MFVAQKQITLNTRLAKIDTDPNTCTSTKHENSKQTWYEINTAVLIKWKQIQFPFEESKKKKSGFISRQNNKIQINGIL